MLYREIIADYFMNYTEHINCLRENVEFSLFLFVERLLNVSVCLSVSLCMC
jgi:hypothetical protein